MGRFAIVIRHREADWSAKPDEEQRRILSRYFQWMDESRRGARASREADWSDEEHSQPPSWTISRARHRARGRIMRVVDGEIVDGPFTETKEIVGGFVVIAAAGWDEARAIARTCPALEVGDWIELREVSVFVDPRGTAS